MICAGMIFCFMTAAELDSSKYTADVVAPMYVCDTISYVTVTPIHKPAPPPSKLHCSGLHTFNEVVKILKIHPRYELNLDEFNQIRVHFEELTQTNIPHVSGITICPPKHISVYFDFGMYAGYKVNIEDACPEYYYEYVLSYKSPSLRN